MLRTRRTLSIIAVLSPCRSDFGHHKVIHDADIACLLTLQTVVVIQLWLPLAFGGDPAAGVARLVSVALPVARPVWAPPFGVLPPRIWHL